MARRGGPRSACDVAIVGAGIGGLTAGALLAAAGARVVVCEQHDRPGGYCHAWTRATRLDGLRARFTFDACVHEVSGARADGAVGTILRRLGAPEIEWGRSTHEYCLPTRSVRVDCDAAEYVRSLQRAFPGEARGIGVFFSTMQRCYDELYANSRHTGGLPRSPRTAEEIRKFRDGCPTLSRLIAERFVDVRDAHVGDPEVRKVLSVLSAYVTDDVGSLSFANMLPLFGFYFRGGWYPRGSSQALANALTRCIQRDGGEVRLRAAVARILTTHGRAQGLRLADGHIVVANSVISSADAYRTLVEMLDVPSIRPEYEPTNSAFLVFLGLRGRLRLASSTFVVDGDGGVILSYPPFAEDRAPPGYSTLALTSLLPASGVRVWERDATYEARKWALGDQLISLAEKRVPGLSGRIVLREHGSPATLKRYTWASDAAAYGATVRTRWPGHDAPIGGLYLVGASSGLGPGIEAVMIGGADVAEMIAQRSRVVTSGERSGSWS